MSKTCHQSFESAAKAIRETDKDTQLHKVTKEEKLNLYGLYKQATEGDCQTSKPEENVESDEREKCESWCKLKGKSKESAEKEYVELAKTLLNKYGASKYIDF